MQYALFAFDDRSAGEAVAPSLETAALGPSIVEIHVHDAVAAKPVFAELDEIVTGGFAHNFATLLEGIFEWGGSVHDAATYSRTVERGGAVLSVSATTLEDRSVVDRLMREAKADHRTDWRDP